jgi:tRNA pseudouridine38-40 synthase
MRFRATVAYDGTGFAGFQKQANGRTVQEELEQAIGRVGEMPVTVTGAGRTDAGVHATGQVIAFELARWPHGTAKLQKAINVLLPMEVAVREVTECDARFHPRFSAISRAYEYTILERTVRDPLRRLYAWQLEHLPDVARMNDAAARLIGEHDFATFGSAPTGDVTVRKVMRAEWRQTGDCLIFQIEANAFLFRMVRRIVATLVRAGQGKISMADVGELLASRDADLAKGAAPACGLCLTHVRYAQAMA